MIPYQQQKIDNAICFFANEYKYKTHKELYSTYLYKFLAFLDFNSIKDNGRPSLGLTYMVYPKGPVPIEIYNNRHNLKTNCFEFKSAGRATINSKDIEKFLIIPKSEPDLDYFSEYEIKEMYNLIEIFADEYVKTSDISEASHESILAWKRAFRRKPNSELKYEDEFFGDVKTKPYNKLSIPEENFILNESLGNISTIEHTNNRKVS